MSDPATPPSPAPGTGTPNPAPAAPGNEPKYLTVEAAAALQKRIDDQSRVLASFESQLKKVAPETPPKTVDDSLTQRVKDLELENKKVTDREARQQEREAISKIADSLINKGVDPEFARRQAKLVHSENKSKFTVTGDDMTSAVKDGDKTVPVSDWMEAYLQTNDGKPLLPPKRNPTSPGLDGRTATVPAPSTARVVSREDLAAGRVDPADITAGKVIVS